MTLYIEFNGEKCSITHWLIHADQPFNGHAQSFLLPDGTIAYTDGLTPEAYAQERGFPVKIITDAELDDMIEDHEASLITEPKEESKEDWWYALEVLPPCRWHHVAGVELFHISERLTGNLVSWHAQYRDKFYSFTDQASRDMGELAQKVKEAAQ